MSSLSSPSHSVPLALSDLARGQKAVITAIDMDPSGGDIYLRLHEMGFDEGINIEVIQKGPFGGDPIAVNVDGVVIALRRSDAQRVRVMLGTAPQPTTAAGIAAHPELAGANT